MKATPRIIDHKKVMMTTDEWNMYEQICRSYDRANFKGEDLFTDLFETDDDGIIIFLKPPSKRFTSMEVFFFLMAVMQHQHITLMYSRVEDACARVDAALKKL